MKQKKKMSRKLKIILSVVVLLVAAIGGFGAYFISEMNKAPATIEESDAKFETTLKEAPKDGTLPTDHSATDVIAYILWTVENTSEFKVITTGKANASIAVQEISNTRIVKDNKAMVSTISSGMISVGKQRYFENEKVLLRDFEKVDGVKATWKNQVPECITYKENISRYGWLPFKANGYVICDDTYLNKDEIKVEVLGDNLYKVAFDLNPGNDYAPFWYRREILTNSSSTIPPEFISIHAEFTFDKDYRMIYQDFKESYKVKSMGVEAVTNTDVRDEFTYDNVEFDQEYLDYFLQYKDLQPKEFTGEEIEIKEDIASILISSLQNGNNDVLFDLNLDINGKKLDGNIALNISDLNNISVKAKLKELELEFINNNIYVSLGDLKLKGSIDDITNLINGFIKESDNASSSLDVNQILAELNNAEVVETDSSINLSTTLNLLGIDINLSANIAKNESNYILLDANVNVIIADNVITLDLVKGENTFQEKDYTNYNEIKNLSFIIDFVKSVIDNKSLGFDANVNYNDLLVDLSGDLSFKDDVIYLYLDANIEYKGIKLPINIAYYNNIIYFNYANIHFKASLADIMLLISKHTEEPVTLDLSIDINKILDIILNINYNDLFNRFVLDENSLDLSVNLNEFLANLNEIQLSLKKDESLNASIIYDLLSANIQFRDYEYKAVANNDYLSLSDISYIINDAIAITKSQKINAKINAKYNDIEFNVDAYVDFTSDIKAKLLINALNMDIVLYYFNDTKTIYIEYKDVYAKLDLNELLSSLNIELSNPSINDILNILAKIELDKVINYLGDIKGTTVLGLDLSSLNIDTRGIIDLTDIIYINLNDTKDGFKIKIDNLFNLSIDVLTSFDGEISLKDREYISLNSYIDSILDLVNSTKYDIKLSGSYKDIKLTANGIFNRDELSLKLNINLSYKTSNFDLDLYYFHNDNDKFYIDFKDLHAYISLSDIKDYLSLDNTNININDILNTLLSKDLNKILEKLELTEEKLSIGLNLSDFNIDTMGLIDLTNTINIDLLKIENGFGLSIKDLFDLNIEVTKTENEFTLPDYDYIDLFGYIKDVLDLIANTKYDIKLSGEYKDIKLDLNGIFDREKLALSLNVKVSYKNNTFDINVYYFHNNEDTFYVDFKDLHASIKLEDIKAYLPVTDNIDINSILDTLLSKDLSKIIDKLAIEENKLSLGLNLSEFDIDTKGLIDLTNTINIDLIKLESGFGVSVKELFNLNALIVSTEDEVILPDYDYVNINDYIKNIMDLANSTKYEIALSGSYNDITLSANGVFDREELALSLNVKLTYKNNTFDINVYYLHNNEDTFYVDFKDLHASIKLEEIKAYLPVTDNIDINSILDTILSKDLAKILNKLSLDNDKLSLGLDLSEFDIDTKGLVDLTNTINIDLIKLESGFGVSVKELFNLNALIKPTDNNIVLPDYDYINLNSYIEKIIDLVNSTKYEIALSGSYNDIALSANGVFDREELSLALDLNITYKNNTFNINVYYFHNNEDTFYVDFKDLHASIKLEDIKSYLPVNDEVNINSILETLLSKDLNKILDKLSIDDDKLSLGLDLSDLEIDTKGLIDLSNIINIDLLKIENGFGITVYELFDLNALIVSTDKVVSLPDNNYIDLNSYIKNVIDLVNSTKYDIKLSGSYNDITLSANGIFDREKLALSLNINLMYKTNSFDINVYYFHNNEDTFYIDFKDLHASIKLEDIKSYLPVDNNINVESILNTLLSKDLCKILNKLALDDDKLSLGLDLSDLEIDTKGLIDLSNIINIELIKLDLGFGLSVNELFNLNAEIKPTDANVELFDNNYVDINPFIETIMDLVDSTKYEIALSGSYKDIKLNASGIFDRETLSLSLDLDITYKNNTFNINLNYYHEHDNLNDVFYVNFKDLHAYITLDDIISLIPNTSNEVSIDSILDTILSKDLNKILEALTLTDSKLLVGINLSDFNIDTKGIIDLNNTINIELERIENGAQLSVAELFNLSANITTTDKEVEFNANNYINLASLVNNISNIINIINKESFRLNVNLNANISSIVSLLAKDIKVDGYIDFLYNDGYSINANLSLKYDNIIATINVKYSDEYVYIKMLGIDIKLNVNEFKSLIEEVMTKFEIDDGSLNVDDNQLMDKLISVINTIMLVNENSISLDLNSLLDKLSLITITLIENNSEYSMNIDMDILDCVVELTSVDYYDLEFNDDYLEYDDILNLCDMVAKILDIAKNKEFNLNLDFSVYDSGKKHLDVNGTLKFKIYENGKFDFEASGVIKQYESGKTKYHILDLVLISKEYFGTIDAEDMIYITYGTIENSNSKIKIYLPLSKVLGMAGTISQLLGVDLSFLDQYSSFNFNDIDTTQVKNLISSSTDGKIINLDSIISTFVASLGRLELGLNLGDLLAQPENNIVSLVVDTNTNGNVIAGLSLHNLYTVYHSVSDNTMFNIDEITLVDEEVNITKPDLTGYYDLSNIDNLVNGLITTATFKDFEINTSAKLNMIGLDLISLPVNIKVHVNDDGTPIIHAYIDSSSTLAGIAFKTRKLNIYYKDGYVYINKVVRSGFLNLGSTTYNLKITSETFMDDIVYYLLEYGLEATDVVMNNVNGSANENHVIDAGKVLSSYSSTETEFSVALSLEELTGNSMLGDLSLTLGLTDVITNTETGETNKALTYVKNLNVKLLGFINLNVDSLSLTNISNKKVNSVDLSSLNSFISSYSYPIDKSYKGNSVDETMSHKITFIKGLGQDSVVLTGQAGEQIAVPTMGNVTYNGVTYRFVGWYMDKDLTEEYNLATFDNDNHKIYAKYEEI